ncbi:hypothetical protein CVT25_012099 [Psilocybe cyanescens]|uniref:Nitrate reductase [NADPH] n=1 Tax=Psilocybe cyanescens TaxID=93625 RepID=A0A409VXH0_PSICY|nr:hypothetical protein CVT25_012099 [Psilocybe cyanescens]
MLPAVSPLSSSYSLSEYSSTSPSSVGHELQEENAISQRSSVRLPSPFYPPSLVQKFQECDSQALIPRGLPSYLNLPNMPTESACSDIDSPDLGTPDAWIPRDPRLVRLTGKHPFNTEAKLRDLYAEGFITSSNLFFVRNHGAVPKIDQERADNWQLKVHGLCANPTTLTLEDLRTKFQVVTIPITLVCAGNRRKEQNVVQQSLGFSWGAAGLSTALFTGVYLADILAFVHPNRWAKHVVFEGADELPNGPYGTSQLLSWATDAQKRMIISWAMNGLALEPDHGYPLRLVVPGQIGGRSVKWLNRIELSSVESQHHLHFHDNKVLPMPLGPDQARKEKKWWYDPRYIIRDLNVNSAIAQPDHEEILDTLLALRPTYTIKGYAYAGGGRRVTRVEISFDSGTTWELAFIKYPEDAYRTVSFASDPIYGDLDMREVDTCFCWCFWSFEVSLERLKNNNAIVVRGMDEALALQPRDMYWNATGMMNNWWFRVVIHHLENGKLRFEHPTMAGTQLGGWMQRLKDEGLDPSKPDFSSHSRRPDTANSIHAKPPDKISMIRPDITKKIGQAELESDKAKEEAWFVVCGEVYIGSKFFKDHPGGAPSIELVAGEDATEDFMAIHSSDAQKQLAEFHIGTLHQVNAEANVSITADNAAKSASTLTSVVGNSIEDVNDPTKPFLQTKKWNSVKLVEIRAVSKNAKVFRFALRDKNQELGLAFGQHLYVRLRRKGAARSTGADMLGEMVQRAYTPLFERDDKGFVDLLVKIYYPTPEFPEGGRITLGFEHLTIGDSIELKGPIGNFIWKGRGIATFNHQDIRVSEIGLICAGSGITPILQVLRAILSDPLSCQDEKLKTKVWVLDVNRYFEDILCKDEIDRLARENEELVKVQYSLTGKDVPDGWEYSKGRITVEMLIKHLPSPGKEKVVCICGPHPMEQNVIAIDPAATLLSLPHQSGSELGGYQHPHSALSTHSPSSNACSSLPPSPSPATPQTIVPASLQHENTSPHAPYLHTYHGMGSSLDDGFTLAEAYPLLPLYVSDKFTVDYPNDIFEFNWSEASKDLHDPEPLLPIPPLADTRSPSPIQSSLWSSRHCSTSTRTQRYSPYARAVTTAAPSREICGRSNDITATLGAGIVSDSLDYQQSTSAPNFYPPLGETEITPYIRSEQIQNHEDHSSGFAPVERKINDNPGTTTARR